MTSPTSTAGSAESTPPYLAYARFESFIGSLHGKPLPTRIDRSLMHKMSGGDQSQVRVALRFLGLAEGDDSAVTGKLKLLVETYEKPPSPAWKAHFAEIIRNAYEPIVGELGVTATQGQLDERFREVGKLSGSSLVKAVRFYLAAAGAAGVPVSPHFKGTSVSSPSRRAKRPKANNSNGADNEGAKGPSEVLGPGMDEITVPIPGKSVKVWLPADLTQSEFDFVVQTLKTWRKLKTEQGQRE